MLFRSSGAVVKNLPADAEDSGSIPGSGRAPGVGNGNPFQNSCLENSMNTGPWWTTVRGVTKSRTGLKRLSLTLQNPLTPHQGGESIFPLLKRG